MNKAINVLYIDDYIPDQRLVRDILQSSQIPFRMTSASTVEDLNRLSGNATFDIVLSELNMFGSRGLAIVDKIEVKFRNTPIVILTGSGSEESAIKAFRRGVTDYVIKSLPYMKNLPLTLRSAVQEYRRNKQGIQFQESESRYQRLVEGSPDAIVIYQDRRIAYVNPAGMELAGAAHAKDILGQSLSGFFPEKSRSLAQYWLEKLEKLPEQRSLFGIKLVRADGQPVYVDITAMPFFHNNAPAIQFVIRDVSAQKRRERRLAKLNECFLKFGRNPDENVTILVNTCGALLNATCAIYNRQQGRFLHSAAHWQTPESFNPLDRAEGHICHDVIQKGDDRPLIVRDLQKTHYAQTDPNVKRYQLQTYAGIAVKWNDKALGSLCVVFQEDVALQEDDLRLMNIIAVAIGVEEERKLGKEARRESQERFERLVDASFDGVFIQQNGIIKEANQAFMEMVGGDREKVINRPVIRFVAPETRQIIVEAMKMNNEDLIEVVGMNLEGKKFPMELVGRNCRFKGRSAQIIAVHDISARLLSEINTQERLAFSNALNKIAEAIISEEQSEKILKRTATIVGETLKVDRSLIYHISKKQGKAIGLCEWLTPLQPNIRPTKAIYSLKKFDKTAAHIELTQLPFESHSHDIHEKLIQDKVADALHKKMDITSLLWYPFAFSEEGFYLLICNQVSRRRKWREKELAFLDAVARQISIATLKSELISEQKHLEQQLLQSRKMESIGTLAGGIAHDFNNLLAAIIGYTEATMPLLPKEGLSRSNMQQIYTAAQRGKGMVQQILTFSHQNEREMKPMNIGSLVKEALKLIRATMPSTIEIRKKIVADAGMVLADPANIHQVMMNLCVNAYHAMGDRGGVIEITLKTEKFDVATAKSVPGLQAGRYVQLRVRDNGPGIDPKIINRIFDPFFTTKPAGKGTGMGLSVVHGIVKSHKGAIVVNSEPNKGASFDIYLPQIQAAGVMQKKKAPTMGEIPRGTEHALLVDDEEQLIMVGTQILRQLGYKVTTRNKSTEALQLFAADAQQFDIVLTDYSMPELTGLAMAEEMMKIRPDMPIIIMSGFGDIATQEKAKKIGIREFLNKPVFAKDLGHAIRRVLDNETAWKNGRKAQ